MIKIDPIIAVKDIETSAKWYEQIFGCRRLHGEQGSFAVLVSEEEEILFCLHEWEIHDHHTMADPSITPGNGLILYFRTENMEMIRQNAERIGGMIVEDIHINPHSEKREFSLRDPDGYYLTITEFHQYED